jgi:hypothetical protein
MALRLLPCGASVALLRRGGAYRPSVAMRTLGALQRRAWPLGAPLAASASPAGLHLCAASCASAPAGPPAPTSPPAAAAVATPAPVLKALDKALPFVNRYAEALDVLVPNLRNHEALHSGESIKYLAPLAAQPPGTGKTALGQNITAILRRPRDDAATEAVIAKRLAGAWCWWGQTSAPVAQALHDTRDENLVMRTLLAMSDPVHHETLLALKSAETLVIEMKRLVTPRFGLDFDGALAYAIFCASRRMDGSDPATEDAFLAQRKSLQTAEGAVKAVIRERNGPIVLVLDDITDLADPDFAKYFESVSRDTPLHRAMSKLSLTLQLLHAIPRCFVYCTGRSLWLSSRALIGSGSPLSVQPTLLQPLTPSDVLQALRVPAEPGGRTLLDCLGVAPDLAEPLAERAVALTGGVGRSVQYLLRARQWSAGNGAPTIASAEELGPALESLLPRLANLPSMLRIEWDGEGSVSSGDLPQSVRKQTVQQRLLQLLARTLLLDAPFSPEHTVKVGSDNVRLSDVAATFGLSYSPAEAPQAAGDAPAGDSSLPKGRNHLRLVAGEWLCRSLQNVVGDDPAALASAQLLATMRDFGGTMRGRPFEMLCADALCYRSLLAPDEPLAKLLPHLGRSMRGNDPVPRLTVVALPKAVAYKHQQRLSADEKAALLQSRYRWTGKHTIHSKDLSWLLADWLPAGCLGVPADAQSGSQDLFLRLGGGVVGFALKAASASAGTDWSDVRDELSKAPVLSAGVPYTLVLWSLHLAPQLGEAMGAADAEMFAPGTWAVCKEKKKLLLRPKAANSNANANAAGASSSYDGGIQQPHVGQAHAAGGATVSGAASASHVAAEEGKEVFTVAPGMELVIVNPLARAGGGLRELLGNALFNALQGMGDRVGGLSISHLTEWMAHAPPPSTTTAAE